MAKKKDETTTLSYDPVGLVDTRPETTKNGTSSYTPTVTPASSVTNATLNYSPIGLVDTRPETTKSGTSGTNSGTSSNSYDEAKATAYKTYQNSKNVAQETSNGYTSKYTAPTYSASDTTKNYQSQIAALETAGTGSYTSPYQQQIDALLDKIANRESFSYDFNADPLYQNYKDQYTKLGNEAAINAAANASALTGGYGSSYATTAAAQANQQYLTQLNEMIPELQEAALEKYQMEQEDLYNQFDTYNTAENNAYQQYRDTVSDYQTDRDYYQNALSNSQSNDQWNANFAEGQYEYNNSQDYQAYRDAVSDAQWQSQQDYNAYRDTVSDSQWSDEFDYQKERDSVSDKQWQDEFDYQKERDSVSDQQWQDEFDQSYQQWLAEFNYQAERDGISDEQWKAEFDQAYQEWLAEFNEGVREYDQNYNLSITNNSGGSSSGNSGENYDTDKDSAGSGISDAADKMIETIAMQAQQNQNINQFESYLQGLVRAGRIEESDVDILKSWYSSGAFETAEDNSLSSGASSKLTAIKNAASSQSSATFQSYIDSLVNNNTITEADRTLLLKMYQSGELK